MGGNITVLAPTGGDILSWRQRNMFINNEDEDDDCVIVKRFVVLSLSQILSKSQESESSKHTNIFDICLIKKLIQESPGKISCTDLWGVLYVGCNKAGDQKLKIIGCYRYSDQLLAASHYYNYFHDATEFASHASHTNHRINSTKCVKTSTSWHRSDGQQGGNKSSLSTGRVTSVPCTASMPLIQ